MRRLIIITILLASAIWSNSLDAKTIHVSKAGSATSPYDTWAKAATTIAQVNAAIAAGDTVLIGRGVYLHSQIVPPTGSTRPNMTYYLDSAYVANGSNNFSGLAQINGADTIPKASWALDTGLRYVATWVNSDCYEDDDIYFGTQNGEFLQVTNTLDEVDDAPGLIFYNSTSNLLYVRCIGDVNPNTVEIQASCRPTVFFNDTDQDNIYFGGLDIRNGKKGTIHFAAGADSCIWRHCNITRAGYLPTANGAVIFSNGHDFDAGARDSSGSWETTYNRFIEFETCSIGVIKAEWDQGAVAHRGSGFIGYDITDTRFDSCVFFDILGDAIEAKNSYATDTDRIFERLTISYCKFDGASFDMGRGVNLYTGAAQCSVYGSIFVNCYEVGVMIGNSSSVPVNDGGLHTIFNNTFYSCNEGVQIMSTEGATGDYADYTGDIKYNIIYDLVAGEFGGTHMIDVRRSVTGLTVTIDSNQYYEPGGSPSFTWGSTTSRDFSYWQGTAGNDANGSTADPGLNTSTFETTSAGTMNRTYGGRTWLKYGAVQDAEDPEPQPSLRVRGRFR